MFLSDFEMLLAKSMDTPDEFLHALAYWTAGAALANRVWVRSPNEVSTNMYLVLVSGPGWWHKSTAVNAANRMLRKTIPPDEFLPGHASVEALAVTIPKLCKNDRGHGVLVYDEFRSFLTHIRKEYAAQIGTLVTEKMEYGIPTQFSRKKDGDVEVKEMPAGFVLSFVASTTIAWMIESMQASDLTGGMLSRFLLVEAKDKTREYALPPPLDDMGLEILAGYLKTLRHRYRDGVEFRFSPDGRSAFEKIYYDLARWAKTQGTPEFPSLISRSHTYVKKAALIHAALAQRDEPWIEEADVEAGAEIAIRSVQTCESIMDDIIASTSGDFGALLLRVRKMIASAKRVSKADLLARTHLKNSDMDDILHSLAMQKVIDRELEGGQEFVTWKGA